MKTPFCFILVDNINNKSQVDYSELIKTVTEIIESKGFSVAVKQLVVEEEDKKDISALKLKNLDDCWVAVPSQFNSQDYEATYFCCKGNYVIVLINKKTKEHIKLKSSVHPTTQIAIDEAYEWFKVRELDITDLNNWLVKE